MKKEKKSTATKALFFFVAVLIGWLTGFNERQNKPRQIDFQRNEYWTLAVLPQPADQGSLVGLISALSLWGESSQSAIQQAPVRPNGWRVASIFETGKRSGVLISFEDQEKPAKRLYIGECLPDGSLVFEVEGTKMRSISNGRVQDWKVSTDYTEATMRPCKPRDNRKK